MTENIIFYFVCIFFSLIGLGAIWENRYSYMKTYIFIFIGMPLIIAFLQTININALLLFDIRELLAFVKESPSQLIGRGKAVLFIWWVMCIIAYFTVVFCLLVQLKKGITKKFNSVGEKNMSPIIKSQNTDPPGKV